MKIIPVLVLFLSSMAMLCAEVPAGGVSLISADPLAGKRVFNPGDNAGQPVASSELVTVDGPGFDQAIRVAVVNPSGEFYNGAVYLPTQVAVAKGDVLLARLYFRSVANAEETGNGIATVFVQGPPPQYKKYLVREISAGAEWTEFLLPFLVTDAWPAGKLTLLVGAGGGSKPQTWELGGIELLNYGKQKTVEELPVTRATYGGREPDASWREAAEARIEKYRKGDFRVVVKDAQGDVVSGMQVEIKFQRHAYHFGSVISASHLMGEGPDNDQYREKLLEMFNQSGTENDLKWGPWDGDHGQRYNQAQTLAALQWLQEHGYYIRGHVLVWPSRQYLSKRAQALLPNDPKEADPAAKEMILAHIDDITSSTAEYVNEWDVVNEPYTNHYLMDAFGDEVMVDWFKRARENLPTQGLFLNDYAILSSNGRDKKHQQDFEDTLKYLQANGAPITGMGMQGHFGETPTDINQVYEILEHFHETFPELAIRVTEFDVRTADEDMQGDYTRDFLTVVFSHPATVGVQCWGFWENAHWIPESAFFDANWRAKPNAVEWKRLVRETWWNDFSGQTNLHGELAERGFYGDYQITAEADGTTAQANFTLSPDGPREIVIQLPQ